jgi:hypothetical protein
MWAALSMTRFCAKCSLSGDFLQVLTAEVIDVDDNNSPNDMLVSEPFGLATETSFHCNFFITVFFPKR